jgi:hypothetical protein
MDGVLEAEGYPRWKGEGRMQTKKLMAVFFAAALLAAIVAGSASAARQEQDGLVNVAIGDITLEDINIAAAVNAVVQACPNVDAAVILGIITAIDEGDTGQATFCRVDDGKVRVKQN